MSECWFCFWGWHPRVKMLFDDAVRALTLLGDPQPYGFDGPLLFGPAHIVWEDENFDSAQWCLDHFDEYKGKWNEAQLEIVRWSLWELLKLPEAFKVEPPNYDGENPKRFPPIW